MLLKQLVHVQIKLCQHLLLVVLGALCGEILENVFSHMGLRFWREHGPFPPQESVHGYPDYIAACLLQSNSAFVHRQDLPILLIGLATDVLSGFEAGLFQQVCRVFDRTIRGQFSHDGLPWCGLACRTTCRSSRRLHLVRCPGRGQRHLHDALKNHDHVMG